MNSRNKVTRPCDCPGLPTEIPAGPQETAINLPTEGEFSEQSDVNL